MSDIHDPKGLMRLRFKCPECGGQMFGTSNSTSENWIGHCHDFWPDGTRCRYTWKRSMDDELGVFVKEATKEDGE